LQAVGAFTTLRTNCGAALAWAKELRGRAWHLRGAAQVLAGGEAEPVNAAGTAQAVPPTQG